MNWQPLSVEEQAHGQVQCAECGAKGRAGRLVCWAGVWRCKGCERLRAAYLNEGSVARVRYELRSVGAPDFALEFGRDGAPTTAGVR